MIVGLWSLVGGVFYFFYVYRQGDKIPDDLGEPEE